MLDRTAALGIVVSISLLAAYAMPEAAFRELSPDSRLSVGVQKAGRMTLLSPRIVSAEEGGVPEDPDNGPLHLRPPRPVEPPDGRSQSSQTKDGQDTHDTQKKDSHDGRKKDSQDSRSWEALELARGDPAALSIEPSAETAATESESPAHDAEDPAGPEESTDDSEAAPEEDPFPQSQREASDRSGYSSAAAVSPSRSGLATYYHPSLEGGIMSNGRPYRSSAMTAASNTYQMGTRLRVTHLNQSIVVEVTDRGAFSHALDLSSGAFVALAGSLAPGIIRISIEEIW